ncbi:MAG: ATP phosphoribosyltransferase regulatory subunit [Clostridia bacterium]|nr:ATP phosphoribosyltransferase regulatory subunit [Clostridia bacterium]
MESMERDARMRDEAAIRGLKAIYRQYGYKPFRMSRFEEYDFYADNKSFLQSENVITFTDLNGKLMALKPDVTLSIVKSASDTATEKVFYSENVYRADMGRGERGFSEIMQVGLECIGDIDVYESSEVLMLAGRSLERFSDTFALDVSHMGFVQGMLTDSGLPASRQAQALNCIASRNESGVRALCAGLDAGTTAGLCALATLYGGVPALLPQLRAIGKSAQTAAALDELAAIYEVLCGCGLGEKVHLDFSIVNDMNYYNGVIFRGFVSGVPSSVLSGGRYDNLMHKMGKTAGAIGFAVYLNVLEQYLYADEGYDADVLLTYDADVSASMVARRVAALTAQGKSVRVQKKADALRCKEHIHLTKEAEA